MVSIVPDAARMKVREFDTSKSVYTPDTSYAGEGKKAIGGILQEQYEKQVRKEVAQAGVDFQVMKAQEDIKYVDDNDEDTIVDRYEAGTMEGLGAAAAGITDSEVRAAFVEQSRVGIEEGKSKMTLLAHSKRGDKQIAYLTNATDTIMKGAIAGGNLKDAHSAIEGMWRSLQEEGHVSAVDAEGSIRKAKYDMALGKLKSMEPEEQIDALTQPWMTEIPLDVRRAIEVKALDQLRLRSAQVAARDVMDLPPGEAESALWEKLGPGKLYDGAMVEYMKHRGLQARDKAQKQGELYNVFHDGVVGGTLTTHQIADEYPTEWFDIEPAIRNNLLSIEAQRATGKTRTQSDFKTLNKLMWLYKTNRFTEAYDFLHENSAMLSPAHQNQWLGLTVDGVLPDESKALFDHQKMLDELTPHMSPESRMNLYMKLGEWYEGEKTLYGKYPDANAVRVHIKGVLIPHKTAELLSITVGSQIESDMDMENMVDAYSYKETEEEQEAFLNRQELPVREQIVARAQLRKAEEEGDQKAVIEQKQEMADRHSQGFIDLEMRNPTIYRDAHETFPEGYDPSYQELEAVFNRLVEMRSGS